MKKTALLLSALLVVLSVAGCGVNENAAVSVSEPVVVGEPEEDFYEFEEEEEIFDNDWQFSTPEEHGVNGEMLKRLHAAIEDVNIYCVVTAKDGFIIDEYYNREDLNENSVFRMASVTKSVSGALIGLAIENGYISSVDAMLPEFFPHLDVPEQADKRNITVEHLLTHTSGIYWNEWGANGDYFMRFYRSENWVEFVFSQHMSSTPGTTFNYTTGGSHLLGAVIEAAYGDTAFEFGKKYLFGPMGMNSVQWSTDPQGVTDAGNGIAMTARDAAKFGQLYLDGGEWKGRQILPKEWVERTVQRQAAGSPGTGEHGYSWWLRSFGGYQTYFAMGHGGQYIFVVPELNLVTVMASRVPDTYLPQRYFAEYIIPACE